MSSLSSMFLNPITLENAKWILLTSSFLGGVVASLSPCSLPMLPVIIGYIGGYSNSSFPRVFMQLLSFILGSAIVFTTIGIICALTGNVFISIAGNYFVLIIASILLIMGLNLVGVLDLPINSIIKKIPTSNSKGVFVYPFILGMTFALAGTPCSTPILAGIMSIASVSSNIALAILMLFLFALGQGLILMLVGLFTSAVKQLGVISRFSGMLLKVCGWLLIVVSVFFYYKVFSSLFS